MVTENKYHMTNGERHDMSLFGAFPNCGKIEFRLTFSDCPVPRGVRLVLHSDGLADDDGERYLERELCAVNEQNGVFICTIDTSELTKLSVQGLFYYRYDVTDVGGAYSLGGEGVTELALHDAEGDRQLLIYDADFTTSGVFKGGMIYHVFVDRFAASGKYPLRDGAKLNPDWEDGIPEFAHRRGAPIKNDEFFGGDLTGIEEKLDYISSLGVSVIYLSPVFSSVSNHKYDTSDYMEVDPAFGGDAALASLTEKCRERGITVILDGVFNHTGDDSIYFDRYGKYGGAYVDRTSPYFEWFNFRSYPDDYECWWGIKILPRVDSACGSFRRYVLGEGGVVEKYMRMGVGGFRLDVADELSDTFLDELREKVKSENEDSLIVGEVWEDASCKIAYSKRRHYLNGAELDSVMNYPLREGIISFIKYGDHALLRRVLETIYRKYPKCVSDSLMNFLGTHDTERIITVLAGEDGEGKTPAELAVIKLSSEERERGRRLVMCAFAICATAYGIPSIFYGDEAGLEGYHDPFCRRPFPWGCEDAELEDFYKRIGQFRKSEPIFREGCFRVVDSSENVFVTERFDDVTSLYTVVTRNGEYTFIPPKDCRCVFTSDNTSPDNPFHIPPYSVRIFKALLY